jgi:Rrf2 family protein
MMFITRKTDYALRIFRTLADGERHTVSDICRKEVIPQQFAYKILKKIEQAGLVKISRGAQGGCVLVSDLRKTSLYDLMNVLEEDPAISSCVKDGYDCEWKKQCVMQCIVHKQLTHMQEFINEELRRCSLHKLVWGTD